MNTTSEQQIPKDKQNEAIDLDETGFEFSNGGGQNKADDDFDRLVGALQDIVLRPEFAQLQKGDKLGDYIEGELKKIVPNLNMKDFTRQFKGRMDEIDPQLFDMFESDKSEEEGEEYKSDIDNLVVAGHSAIIHSQNELDLDETEFEFNNGGGQNKADDEFDQFAGALQDIVLRPEFAQLQKEDKLRDYIEGELKKVMPNLNMKDFTSQMKERMDEIDPQLFDMFESHKLEEEGEYKADVDNLIVIGHSAVLHSQNELVSEEAGFEFTNGGGQNKVDDEFDQLMGALQDIVLRPEFAQQKGDKLGDYIEGELKKVVPNLNMKDFTTQMKGRIDEIDPLLFDVLESGKSEEEEEGYKPEFDNLIVTGHSAIIHSQNEKILKKNKEQDASEDKENITQDINLEKKTKIENPGEPPKKLGKVNPLGEQKENIIS